MREEINVGTEGDIKDQKAKYRMYDKTRIKKCMIKNERLKENDGKPFTWKIKPKERIETKEGHLKKGTCVQVAACMGFEEEHPETHIAIGIIDEDGDEIDMCEGMERMAEGFRNEGRIIGRSEGLMEGEKREKKTTLLSLLKVKLGNVSNQLEQAIQNSSIEKLNTLTLSIFDITNEDDVLKIIN